MDPGVAGDDQGSQIPALSAQGIGAQERARPLWLVALLTFFSLGIYGIVWLGVTWSEMKRETHDEGMHPWWHALTQLVPIYAYFRLYAHFALINTLRYRHNQYPSMRLGWVVIGSIVIDVLNGVANVPGSITWVSLIAAALATAITVHGQAGLNSYWNEGPAASAMWQVRPYEWLLLAVAILLFAANIHAMVI